MVTIYEQLAVLLKKQRKRLGLTLDRTAELAGVSRNTVRNLEGAVSPDCSLSVVERVCAAVGLELTFGIRGASVGRQLMTIPSPTATTNNGLESSLPIPGKPTT